MHQSTRGQLIGYVIEALVERSACRFWIRLSFEKTRCEAEQFLNTGLPGDAVESRITPYFRVSRQAVASQCQVVAAKAFPANQTERGNRRVRKAVAPEKLVSA